MKPRIVSVKRESGIIIEVVAECCQIRFTYRKNAGKLTEKRESLAPPGEKPANLYLSNVAYIDLKKEVEAIFSGKNTRRKKSTQAAYHLHPNIMKEARQMHRKAKALILGKKMTVAEAEKSLFLDSTKTAAYRMGDFPYLHKNELWHYENLRRLGIKLMSYGVLGFSRTDQTESQKTKLQFKLTDLNAAIRMQQHILDRYLGTVENLASETDRLDELKSLAEQLRSLVLSWKTLTDGSAAKPEELLAQTNDLAKQIAKNLARCRNPLKTQARSQAVELTEPHDSLDRPNPGAHAARATALLNRLSERLSELELIAPIILKRKLALEAKKDHIFGCLTEALCRLEYLSPAFLKQQPLEEIRSHLGQVLSVLNQVSVLPYRAQAEQAAFYLKHARQRPDNLASAATSVANAKKILSDRPFD